MCAPAGTFYGVMTEEQKTQLRDGEAPRLRRGPHLCPSGGLRRVGGGSDGNYDGRCGSGIRNSNGDRGGEASVVVVVVAAVASGEQAPGVGTYCAVLHTYVMRYDSSGLGPTVRSQSRRFRASSELRYERFGGGACLAWMQGARQRAAWALYRGLSTPCEVLSTRVPFR